MKTANAKADTILEKISVETAATHDILLTADTVVVVNNQVIHAQNINIPPLAYALQHIYYI